MRILRSESIAKEAILYLVPGILEAKELNAIIEETKGTFPAYRVVAASPDRFVAGEPFIPATPELLKETADYLSAFHKGVNIQVQDDEG